MTKQFQVIKVIAPRTKEELEAIRGVDFDKRPPRKIAGYRVQALILAGSDEMWETVEHFALFSKLEDAEALAKKCYGARQNWEKYWVWGPTKTSAFAFMHKEPTAVLETVARP